jgi:hypothetical protein
MVEKVWSRGDWSRKGNWDPTFSGLDERYHRCWTLLEVVKHGIYEPRQPKAA